MIHLAWPWMALLLPTPWLAYRLRPSAAPQGSALFLPFSSALTGAGEAVFSASRLRIGIFTLIWLLLVLAAMRPQWLGEPPPVPSTGRRLLLAVDVSGSMATQDMAGNLSRLQVVQQVAGHFIDGRHGDQVGLILFGTQPYLQSPLSADLATVHQFLDEAVVGIAGPETAIGDAIGMGLKRLDAGQHEHDGHQTVLVLLTDGQSNAGVMPPLEAARLAAQSGLRIYTIGVGAPPERGLFGDSGNNDLDEETLKAIAHITGGAYFRATDADALRAVYARIDQLEPAAGPAQWLRPADEWFTWPLALALLLSVLAVVTGGRTWT
jgi:Ca-activated chloride channel family protein